MWKVVIIMCALGNPCVVMEENPMRHYHDRNECMANSSSKHSELFVAFQDYGSHGYKSEFTCEEVK